MQEGEDKRMLEDREKMLKVCESIIAVEKKLFEALADMYMCRIRLSEAGLTRAGRHRIIDDAEFRRIIEYVEMICRKLRDWGNMIYEMIASLGG